MNLVDRKRKRLVRSVGRISKQYKIVSEKYLIAYNKYSRDDGKPDEWKKYKEVMNRLRKNAKRMLTEYSNIVGGNNHWCIHIADERFEINIKNIKDYETLKGHV